MVPTASLALCAAALGEEVGLARIRRVALQERSEVGGSSRRRVGPLPATG
jgi:hypothetical protein